MTSRAGRPDGVLLIAIWAFVNTALTLVAIAAIATFAYREVIRNSQDGLAGGLFGLSVATMLLLLGLGVNIGAGVGLIKGREWGRVFGIVFAALNLIWFPIGTALGVVALVYLMKPEVREYFEAEPQAVSRAEPRAA